MRFLAFVCLLLACGCTTVYHECPPVKVIDADEMTWIVERLMAKYKHSEGRRLKLEHSSTIYETAVVRLRLEISSQEILEVEKARHLLVDFVEELLRDINSNPIISNQLITYPFDPDRLQITINFESFFGQYIDPYYVGCIEMRGGMVRYSAFDMKDDRWHSWHSRVEPYEKSREISMIERAAKKAYEDERACQPRMLEELFTPPEDDEVR